ncbi:MAG: hypothetical protein QXD13_01690 [Candidatus Pacearchaeota archaeon]
MPIDTMTNETNQRIEGNEGDSNRYPHRVIPGQYHDKEEHKTSGKYPHRVMLDNSYSRIYFPKRKVSNGGGIKRHATLQNLMIECKELLASLAKEVYQKAREEGKEGIFSIFRLYR